MSFTEDELQAFSFILEQRFSAHRQEMEQVIDRRLASVQETIDQRLVALQQETLDSLEEWFINRTQRPDTTLADKLKEQRDQIVQSFSQESEQSSRQVAAAVDRMLAAQMLGIEQLLGQHAGKNQVEAETIDTTTRLETIEVQTELSWEDLVAVLRQVLDERLALLGDALQLSVKNLEQYLTVRLHSLSDELARLQGSRSAYSNGNNAVGSSTSVQEVLSGIEHLERVMESMQVAMTANHALLSNRLYHHQQLPLERAHPNASGQTRVAPANGVGSLLTQAKERLANGLEPIKLDQDDEPTGH
ncbi:MAG TPA: hypothetical protein VGD98_18570 [Ktedonobacteraceae bacterium]